MSDARPPLHPEALADLRKSGLSDETIAACGLHSVRPEDLKRCPIPGVIHALEQALPGERRELVVDHVRGQGGHAVGGPA